MRIERTVMTGVKVMTGIKVTTGRKEITGKSRRLNGSTSNRLVTSRGRMMGNEHTIEVNE